MLIRWTVHERQSCFHWTPLICPKRFQLWAAVNFFDPLSLIRFQHDHLAVIRFPRINFEKNLDFWKQSLINNLFFQIDEDLIGLQPTDQVPGLKSTLLCSHCVIMSQRIPLPYLSPPPNGDQRIGVRLVAIGSVLIVPGTILVALRLYVRTRITRTLGLDDFFVVLSLVRI